jgi:hypothetical protein
MAVVVTAHLRAPSISVAADVAVSREEYPERFLREDRQAPTSGRFCGTLGYGSKFK